MLTNEERALDALGDPTRRVVLKRLRGGGLSVGEIAEGMKVTRPAVYQHLQVLKAARLVTVHAVGTRRVYAIDASGIRTLRDWFDGFWNETLMAFKEAAEREASKQIRARKNH